MGSVDAAIERPQGALERLLGSAIRVDAERLAFAAILVVAFLSRFAMLEPRVMSHDEISHVYYSYNYYRGLGFQHNPLMHGPFQFHVVALSYFLFGATDATARFPAALSGVIAVGLIWVLRRWLGRTGTLVAAALMAVSPYMLYYSRYVRNEAFVVVEGLLMMWAVFRYFEDRQARWLYLLSASLALHFATKETAFIYTALLLLFLGARFVSDALRARWNSPSHRWAFLGGLVVAAGGVGLALAFFFRDLVRATKGLTQGAEVTVTGPAGGPLMVMGLGVGLVGAVLVVAALLAGFGRRLRTEFASLDLLIIVGTVTVTQLSAFFLPVDVIARYGDTSDPQSLLDPIAIQRLWVVLPLILLVAGAIGLAWDWRRWGIAAAIFAAIYIPLYTSLFSHGLGLTTGAVGSLAYWLGQQGVERGSQPWYYFLLVQIPIYEYLPAIGAIAAGVVGLGALVRNRGNHTSSERPAGGLSVPAFLGYWAVAALLAYSVAGEKMPWLTVHLTLPMILLAGWVFGKFLDSVNWRAFREGKAWLVSGLLALALIALGAALGYLLGASPPFHGVGYEQIQSTIGFLVSLGMGVGAVVALTYVAMGWSPKDLARLGGVIVLGILFVLTARAAYRASYINFDNATEFLVYAHSATGSKTLLSQVEDLSMRTSDGLGIDVAYDNETSYPYMWYLRDYTHVHPFGEAPGRDLLNYPVVIVGAGNWARVEPILGDRYYSFEYTRMWWPMQDYWGLTGERIWNAIRSPDYRAALWDLWLNRDYTAYGNLTGTDFSLQAWQPSDRMRLYVRKDIAAMIWDYGALPSAYQPEPFVDPYAEGMTDLSADVILGGQPGGELTMLRPRGIDVAADGTIFVADTGDNRILHLSPEGQVLASWGSFADLAQGEAPGGTFNEPWDVAVAPDGTVYVADTWNHRIQHFTAGGQFLGMFGTFGQGESPTAIWGPRAVEVDEEGRLYVADTGNKRILVFDSQGESIAVLGGPGYEPGHLSEPVGLSIAPDGTLYVADTWNMRVQGFRENLPGEFEAALEWPIEGWYGQSLENKPYLAASGTGQVCASDTEGHRILCFTSEGEFILGWGAFGSLDNQVNLPSGVAFDAQNRLWVVDSGNNRLMRFEPEFGD
jgi:uncharacterized protein (TIGR03663 family)